MISSSHIQSFQFFFFISYNIYINVYVNEIIYIIAIIYYKYIIWHHRQLTEAQDYVLV